MGLWSHGQGRIAMRHWTKARQTCLQNRHDQPVAKESITLTESFAARAQRSEERRVKLWLAVLVAVLAMTCLRRATGGVVMSDDRVFMPTAAVLVIAIALQVPLLITLRRANRGARLLPSWL